MKNTKLIKKPLSLNQIKIELVKMLAKIDSICENNNIKYSLAYGTMLGAIRHKGFIPWDDDLDILMTRKNYEAFLKLDENQLMGLKLLSDKDRRYNLMFAKVQNPQIELKPNEEDRYDKNQKLYIDIFPIDYLSDTLKEGTKIIKKSNFKVCLLVAAQWKHFYINKRHGFFRQIPRFIFYVLSRFVNSKKLVKSLNKNISNTYKNYSYCIQLNRAKIEIFPTKIYDDYIKVPFEGKNFSCIKNYDECLKIIYGDYMKLPPKEKQICPHSYCAYFIDKQD